MISSRGFDVMQRDLLGRTPLHYAAGCPLTRFQLPMQASGVHGFFSLKEQTFMLRISMDLLLSILRPGHDSVMTTKERGCS